MFNGSGGDRQPQMVPVSHPKVGGARFAAFEDAAAKHGGGMPRKDIPDGDGISSQDAASRRAFARENGLT